LRDNDRVSIYTHYGNPTLSLFIAHDGGAGTEIFAGFCRSPAEQAVSIFKGQYVLECVQKKYIIVKLGTMLAWLM